ncbi:MAG: hydrogenase 4 subunit B [Betaproteobacteria bacterium]|nr:hydrogenase 4 subunit B [Betaproteobacteria bacterium]
MSSLSGSGFLSIDWLLTLIAAWLLIGCAGLLAPRQLGFVGRTLYPLGALVGLALAAVAFGALGETAEVAVLPLGLPDLPFHLRLDSLSALFLLLLGGASAGISIYAAGYLRKGEGTAPGLQCLQYHLFLASMALVLLADDAYVYMVAWESMALSSFFLVTSDHRLPEIRRAGYLYLLIAHVGAIGILLSFGVLQSGGDLSISNGVADYTFAHMRAMPHDAFWASAAFGLALFGFGAKAGLLPLHIWLPEAHPAAPSPVSAMMSGVMLKTAIYGMLRVSFDLLHHPLWWWGVLVLALGLLTALFGAVFSAVQSDMKRLLAYSSIENIGLLFVGIGLTLTFQSFGMNALAVLALTAVLYHCLNHAAFKSLLFLCTGSVLHATRERSLGKLGGLIHRMPWVAWLALLGVIAAAGLPPLNGFVSEWLLLQAFLFTPSLPHAYINMLIPVAAAAVALTAALAGFVMVKFFGIVFLGQPREEKISQAHDAGWLERLGLVWLAALCVLLGLFPVYVIEKLDFVTRSLLGVGVYPAGNNTPHGWLLLAPISADRASYEPLVFLLMIGAVITATYLIVHRYWHGRARRSAAWDCGFPLQTARMQDTAEGFSQPLRQVFEPFYRQTRELPTAFDTAPRYRVVVEDHFWYWLYLPVARAAEFGARCVSFLQQGRISIYLLYSFLTLVALLFLVRG